MTEQERPRTEAGQRLIRDAEAAGTVDVGWVRAAVLAIEAEGRQQAVREIRVAFESRFDDQWPEWMDAAWDEAAAEVLAGSPPPLDVERVDTAMQYAIAYMNDPEGLAARREEWRDRLRDALRYLRGDAEYEIDAGDGKTYRFSGDASESPPTLPQHFVRAGQLPEVGDASESGQPPEASDDL